MKWIIALLFLFVIAGCSKSDCQNDSVATMNIGGHNNLAMHIHPKVSITKDDKPINIPGNIGLIGNVMRPIHTHDGSGKLHVEAPCKRDFTLGEFFDIWGIEHNKCFMDYCDSKIEINVNDEVVDNFNNIVLKDNQNIVIKIY